MCTGKVLIQNQAHSEGSAVAANDLLIENEKLQVKLEDGETELMESPVTFHISSISSSAHNLTSTIHDPVTFHSRLVSSVQVHGPLKSPNELPSVPTFQSKGRHSSVTPKDLSERWFISLKKAKDTIKNTMQRILCSALLPLARRYRADQMYERP